MSRKIVILLVVSALVIAGITQVAFAGQGENIREISDCCLEGLTEEQQEQVALAREKRLEAVQNMPERQCGERAELREVFLSELPEEVREQMEARMGERQEKCLQKMERRGNGCGSGGNGMGMGRNR